MVGSAFEITDKVSLFFIPVFKSHGPVSAGSVSGDVVAVVTVVVKPATSNPTNKTAQTKTSKDFISLNISIGC